MSWAPDTISPSKNTEHLLIQGKKKRRKVSNEHSTHKKTGSAVVHGRLNRA